MTYNLGATVSGPYVTNGVQTVFGFGFKIYATTDLEVIYTSAAGVESIVSSSGWTVPATDLGKDAGGNVTITVPPVTGGKITCRLNPLKEQQTNLRNQGSYSPESVERMGDRLAMQILTLAEEVERSVKVDISSGISSTAYLSLAQAAAVSAVSAASTATTKAAEASASAATIGGFDLSGTPAANDSILWDTGAAKFVRKTIAQLASALGLSSYLLSSTAASTYAPLANAALTGNPTAPTPTPGDNDTSIATTGFVQNAINSSGAGGFKNQIMNGNFDIWQRGTSLAITTTPDAFIADRWVHSMGGSGFTVTASRQTHTVGQTDVPGNPKYFYRNTVTTAGSISANTVGQRIEGVENFAGEQFAFSFYMKGSAGFTLDTANSRLRQSFGTGGSPSSIVNIPFNTLTVSTTAITTSWQLVTVTGTLPSITGKTLGTNGNDYLAIELFLPITASFVTDISSVQLERGATATRFERRSLATELALCQRYYYRATPSAVNTNRPFGSGYNETTTLGGWVVNFPVSLRAEPTALEQSGNAAHYQVRHGSIETVCSAVPVFSGTTTERGTVRGTVASGLTAGQGSIFMNATTAAYLAWSAEL